MKNLFVLIFTFLLSTNSFAAGGDGGGSSEASLYDDAVKLVKRAGKLEKKEKLDKAKKLYSQAFTKLEILELVKLGAIQLTLTFGANSAANANVNPSIAPLADETIA